MDMSEEERSPVGPAQLGAGGPSGASAREQPRAWVVVCKGLGLINIVAESAEELVAELRAACIGAQTNAHVFTLVPFDVIDNTPDGAQAVIWFDPALVQAVLNEYKRPAKQTHLRELAAAEAFGFERPIGPEVVVVDDADSSDDDE